MDVAEKNALLEKMRTLAIVDPEDLTDEKYNQALTELQSVLTPEQLRILHTIRARQMLRPDDMLNIDSIGSDIIDGLSPNLVTGQLGLVDPAEVTKPKSGGIAQRDVLALLTGEELSESSIGPRADPGARDIPHGMDKPMTNGGSHTGFGVAKITNGSNGASDGHSTANGTNGVKASNGGSESNGHQKVDGSSDEPHIHVTPLKGNAVQIQDEATRLRMQDTLHRVADEMETPHDTMLRLFNSVSTDIPDPKWYRQFANWPTEPRDIRCQDSP